MSSDSDLRRQAESRADEDELRRLRERL